MNKRLAAALSAYAVLIALGVYLLRGRAFNVDLGGYPFHIDFLWVVVLIFGALIAKTLIAAKAGWTFHNETDRSESDSELNRFDPSAPSRGDLN